MSVLFAVVTAPEWGARQAIGAGGRRRRAGIYASARSKGNVDFSNQSLPKRFVWSVPRRGAKRLIVQSNR
jgi:hypothetical protein